MGGAFVTTRTKLATWGDMGSPCGKRGEGQRLRGPWFASSCSLCSRPPSTPGLSPRSTSLLRSPSNPRALQNAGSTPPIPQQRPGQSIILSFFSRLDPAAEATRQAAEAADYVDAPARSAVRKALAAKKSAERLDVEWLESLEQRRDYKEGEEAWLQVADE
eukprot:gene2361-8669_t